MAFSPDPQCVGTCMTQCGCTQTDRKNAKATPQTNLRIEYLQSGFVLALWRKEEEEVRKVNVNTSRCERQEGLIDCANRCKHKLISQCNQLQTSNDPGEGIS